MRTYKKPYYMAAAALVSGAMGTAHAATTYTWTQAGGGARNWTDGTNWLGGVAPSPTSGDLITMTLTQTANTTLNLGADRTFEDWTMTLNGFQRTFTIDSGFTLTLAGANPTVTTNGNTAVQLSIKSVLAGSDGLIKDGIGLLLLENAGNTFTGDIGLAGGTLQANSVGALGTSGLAKNFTVTGSSTLDVPAGTYTGSVSLGSGAVLTMRGNATRTFSAAVTGAGGLAIASPSTFGSAITTLSSTSNTFTGSVEVGVGTQGPVSLTVNSLADSANSLTLRSGTTNTRDASFIWGSGASSGLTLSQRQIVLAGSHDHIIENANATAANAITVNTDVSVTGTAATMLLQLQGVNAGENTIAGDIPNGASASLSVTKSGTGKWVLSGTNSYTGATTVSQGTLLINGDNSAATGAVTVDAAATLGGTGRVGGNTTLNGTLSPGQSPGTLTFDGDLTVNNGSTYSFEGGDLTDVNGILDLNDNWTLALGTGFQDGGSVTLFTYGSLAASPDLAPTFDLSGLGFTPSGVLSLTDTGSSITLEGISIIPEPASLALIALGGLLIATPRRR